MLRQSASGDYGRKGEGFNLPHLVQSLLHGELLGLKWEDLNLDLNPAVLTLRRSLAQRPGGGFYFTPTKKRSSRRKLFKGIMRRTLSGGTDLYVSEHTLGKR
jgi:hypothetical protein